MPSQYFKTPQHGTGIYVIGWIQLLRGGGDWIVIGEPNKLGFAMSRYSAVCRVARERTALDEGCIGWDSPRLAGDDSGRGDDYDDGIS